MKWRPQDIETVRQMACEGAKAHEIAPIIGKSVRAVLGLCWRHKIGIDNDSGPRRRRGNEPIPDTPKFKFEGIASMPSNLGPRPQGPGVDLLDAGRNQCRYILGDPRSQRCCGEPADGSWCHHHRDELIE